MFLTFEGVRIRVEALDALRAVRDTALTAPQIGRATGRSSGAATNTLNRMVERGVAEVVRLPAEGRFATRYGTLTGYKLTEKGQRLLDYAAANVNQAEVDLAATVPWPVHDGDEIVKKARGTQPTSVFDMGRLFTGDASPLRLS